MNGAFVIPSELAAFLREGRQLSYDPDECECGHVVLQPLSGLRLFEFPLASGGTGHEMGDPHAGQTGSYLVRAVDLAECCEGYDPFGILLWLAQGRMFASWDSDHRTMVVFPDVTWSDICKDPLRYLNAQWTSSAGVRAHPWEYGIWDASFGQFSPPRQVDWRSE